MLFKALPCPLDHRAHHCLPPEHKEDTGIIWLVLQWGKLRPRARICPRSLIQLKVNLGWGLSQGRWSAEPTSHHPRHRESERWAPASEGLEKGGWVKRRTQALGQGRAKRRTQALGQGRASPGAKGRRSGVCGAREQAKATRNGNLRLLLVPRWTK